MNLKDLKKQNEKKNATKSTKKERYKKFARFKNTAHKCFGDPFTIVGVCLRKCSNRDIKCNDCYRWSELEEIKDGK